MCARGKEGGGIERGRITHFRTMKSGGYILYRPIRNDVGGKNIIKKEVLLNRVRTNALEASVSPLPRPAQVHHPVISLALSMPLMTNTSLLMPMNICPVSTRSNVDLPARSHPRV
jgi:hypothetical protein